MAKSLSTYVKELKTNLENKGYKKDIPLDVFRSEFMIVSGYNRKKVIEWVDNLKLCKLITVKDDLVNFM